MRGAKSLGASFNDPASGGGGRRVVLTDAASSHCDSPDVLLVRVSGEPDIVRALAGVLEKELKLHCEAARRSVEAAAVALAALAQCRTAPLAEYCEAVGHLQGALTQTPLSLADRGRVAAAFERVVAPFAIDYGHTAPRLFITRAEHAGFLRQHCFNAGIALALCGSSGEDIPERGYLLYGDKKPPNSFRPGRDAALQTLGPYVPDAITWSAGKGAISADAPFEVQVVQNQLARMRTARWPEPSWHTMLALGCAAARMTTPAFDDVEVRNGVALEILVALETALDGQHDLEFAVVSGGAIFDGDQELRRALDRVLALLNARRAAEARVTQTVRIGGDALGLNPLSVPGDVFVAAASWIVSSRIVLPILCRVMPNMRVFFVDVLTALCDAAGADGRAARAAKPRIVARMELPLALKDGCKVPKAGAVGRDALLQALRRPAVLDGLDGEARARLEDVTDLVESHVTEVEAMADSSGKPLRYLVDVVIPEGSGDVLLALDRLDVVFYGSRIGSRRAAEAEFIRRMAPEPAILPDSPAAGWFAAPGRQVALQAALVRLAPHRGHSAFWPETSGRDHKSAMPLSFAARQAAVRALYAGAKVRGDDLFEASHWAAGHNVTVTAMRDSILVETNETLASAAIETSDLWRQLDPRPLDVSVVRRLVSPAVMRSATPRQRGRLALALAELPDGCVAEVLNTDKVLALAGLAAVDVNDDDGGDEAADAVCELVQRSAVKVPLRAELLCMWLVARRWHNSQTARLSSITSPGLTASWSSSGDDEDDYVSADVDECDFRMLLETMSDEEPPPPPPPPPPQLLSTRATQAAAEFLARSLVGVADKPAFVARLFLQFELCAKPEWDDGDRNWIRTVRAAIVNEESGILRPRSSLAKALDEAVERALVRQGVTRPRARGAPAISSPRAPAPAPAATEDDEQEDDDLGDEIDPVLGVVERAAHAAAHKMAGDERWSRHVAEAAARQAFEIVETAFVPMPGVEGGIMPRTERDRRAYKVLERMCNEEVCDANGVPLVAWRKATMTEPMMFAIRKWRDEMEDKVQEYPNHVASRVAKPEIHLCDIALGGKAKDRVGNGFLRDTYKRRGGGVKLKSRELFLPADSLKGIEALPEFAVREAEDRHCRHNDRHLVFHTPKAAGLLGAHHAPPPLVLTARALRELPLQIDATHVTIVYADEDDLHLFAERRHPRNPYVSREMGVFLLAAIRKSGTPQWRYKRHKVPQDRNWRLFLSAAAEMQFQRAVLAPTEIRGPVPPRKRRRLDRRPATAASTAASSVEDDEDDEEEEATAAAAEATAAAEEEDAFWQQMLLNMHRATRARNQRHPGRPQATPAFQAATFPTVMRHLLYDLQKGRCRYSSVPIMARRQADWQASPERLDTLRGYSADNVVLVARELNHRTQMDPLSTLCVQLCDPMAVPVPMPRRRAWPRAGLFPRRSSSSLTRAETAAPSVGDSDAKRCSACKRHLPVGHYSKNAAARDGLQTLCRSCQRIARKAAAYSSEEQHMNALAAQARANARSRARTRPEVGVCEVTGEDVLAKFIAQGRRCFYSRLPLKTTGASLFTASLERKDPNIGYTHDNTVLIAAFLNTAAQWTPAKYQLFRAHGVANLRRQVAHFGLDMADLERALRDHAFWHER